MTTQPAHRKAKAKMYEACIVCGKPKKIPTTRQKGVPRSEYERDPYCSTICAKADHGVPSTMGATSS